MNPIDVFGLAACVFTVWLYAIVGVVLWMTEPPKDDLSTPRAIFQALLSAFVWTIAAVVGLCLAAGLCTLVDHWLVQDVCAEQPISCVSVMRVL